MNRWTSEWSAGRTVRLWRASSWLVSLALRLGPWGWVNLTRNQRIGSGRVRSHAFGNTLLVFPSKRTRPSSCLLCWLGRPPGGDHTGVRASVWGLCSPSWTRYCRLSLLVSVLGSLQSRKRNPSSVFLPRTFWVLAMVLEVCFSNTHLMASCFSPLIKPLEVGVDIAGTGRSSATHWLCELWWVKCSEPLSQFL